VDGADGQGGGQRELASHAGLRLGKAVENSGHYTAGEDGGQISLRIRSSTMLAEGGFSPPVASLAYISVLQSKEAGQPPKLESLRFC
jgi:hypothetical protein